MLLLTTLVLFGSCGNKKEGAKKAPIRVKTEIMTTGSSVIGQTYVGLYMDEGTQRIQVFSDSLLSSDFPDLKDQPQRADPYF